MSSAQPKIKAEKDIILESEVNIMGVITSNNKKYIRRNQI